LEVYFDLWDASERASHTLGKSDAYVNEAGRQSSTLQEAKCMVAAGLTWLSKGQAPGSVFRFRTDSKNCFFLAQKMRSKVQAVNEVWAKLAERMDDAACSIDVLWQSRETADAKLSDMLSRCPSSFSAMQAYRLAAGQAACRRYPLPPSVRTLIRT
jgi:hypothetical protein